MIRNVLDVFGKRKWGVLEMVKNNRKVLIDTIARMVVSPL